MSDENARARTDDGSVSFRSPRGRFSYRDSRDHFENGVLRLLQLDLAAFERWLAEAEAEAETAPGDDLAALGAAYQRLRAAATAGAAPGAAAPPAAVPVAPGPAGELGRLWHASIAESPRFGVARALDGAFGWLVRPAGGGESGGWVREQTPPVYEESYFEGDLTQAGGYGDYAAQAGWRLEKAARQVGELHARLDLAPGARVLDVGSGYGFFRRALGDAGFAHDGLEISAHARAVARRMYGFDTTGGALGEQRAAWAGRFDVVTLWDMIEHVDDPRALLADVASILRPGGVAAIKTPNLDCPEADVFGPHYHSLKREHLVYFSAASLHATARAAGLEPLWTSSRSHLLLGFVGAERIAAWETALRGADLTVYLRKSA